MRPTAATVGLFQVPDNLDSDRLIAGVNATERARYRSLKHCPKRAQQYLASRWLLRAHLAPELDVPPIDVPLRDQPGGPPTLAGTAYRLGLSHSGARCVCIASTRARVGCDVERQRPRRRLNDIATQFFNSAEAAHLNCVDADRAHHDFYRLWTLKEASQKARGRGIAGGLHTPAFALTPTWQCLETPFPAAWTFASSVLGELADTYSLALAIAGAGSPARFTVHDYALTESGVVKRPGRAHWRIISVHGEVAEKAVDNNGCD